MNDLMRHVRGKSVRIWQMNSKAEIWKVSPSKRTLPSVPRNFPINMVSGVFGYTNRIWGKDVVNSNQVL